MGFRMHGYRFEDAAVSPERRRSIWQMVAGHKRKEDGQHVERHELALARDITRKMGGGEAGGSHKFGSEAELSGVGQY